MHCVVIPNYLTADMELDCLSSLSDEMRERRERVGVVDNASGDGSAERIERAIVDREWK